MEIRMEISTLLEPSPFAQAIRGLARDAHQTLAHSPSTASPTDPTASSLAWRNAGRRGTTV